MNDVELQAMHDEIWRQIYDRQKGQNSHLNALDRIVNDLNSASQHAERLPQDDEEESAHNVDFV